MTKVTNIGLSKASRQVKVAEIFIDNPYITPAEIASILSVSPQIINNDVKEMTRKLNKASIDMYEMHRERILKEISSMKSACKTKLSRCRGAQAGTRWVEEWTKLTEKECKILGIYAPKRAMAMIAHVGGEEGKLLSKERRDAVIDAIVLGHETGIIEIGAPEETQ